MDFQYGTIPKRFVVRYNIVRQLNHPKSNDKIKNMPKQGPADLGVHVRDPLEVGNLSNRKQGPHYIHPY